MDNENDNMSTSPRISISDSSGSDDDQDIPVSPEELHNQEVEYRAYLLGRQGPGHSSGNAVAGPSGAQSPYETWKNMMIQRYGIRSHALSNRYRKQPATIRWRDNRGVEFVTPVCSTAPKFPYPSGIRPHDFNNLRAVPNAVPSTSAEGFNRPFKIRRMAFAAASPPPERVNNTDVNGNNMVDGAQYQGDMEEDEMEANNEREDEAEEQEEDVAERRNEEAIQEPAATPVTNETYERTGVTEMPLNQALLTLLECPVCLECMEPPMAQCRRGHLTCHTCREKMPRCPVCRASFTSVRNRAMEQVAEKLQYPCRHGCGAVVTLKSRVSHEANCASRRYACPLAGCQSEPLPHEALINHFLDVHPDVIAFGSKGTFRYCRTSNQHDWIMTSHNDIFHIQFHTSTRNQGIYGSVTFIGPKKLASKYRYEITLAGQECSRKLVYTRDTHNDLECRLQVYAQGDAFFVSFDTALSINKPHFNGAHNFRVEIHPNEQVSNEEERA